MPSKSLRPCAEVGCPNLTNKGPRCTDHTQSYRRDYETHRRPERDLTLKFYRSKVWQSARRGVLRAEPCCRDCHERDGRAVPATDVDHIVAFRDGGDATAPSNLRPLCKGCHSRRTMAATRAAGGFGCSRSR